MDYATALERIEQLQALDTEAINPVCRTRLLSHGRKVEHAIIFLHGFTNCPRQFAELAQDFFAQGCNVLTPRLPRHGLRERLKTDIARLTAAELIAYTGELLDLAHGLGERVTLAGLSLGGTLALWAAQTRPDLDRAVAIAPLIAPPNLPRPLLPLLVGLARLLPNLFVWWDGKLKDKAPGPPHAYPRFPSRGLAGIFRIAARVEASAARPGAVPVARTVLLVTNASDPAVDNRASKAIIENWRAHGARQIATYEFDASLHLIHDMIDIQQTAQQAEVVYPVLRELIGGGG